MTNFTETDLLGMEKQSYAEIDFSEKKPVVSEEAVRLSKKEKKWVWGIGGMIVLLSLVLTASVELDPAPASATSFLYFSGDSVTLDSEAAPSYQASICCISCWQAHQERMEVFSRPKFTRIDPDLVPPFETTTLVGYTPPNWFILRGIPEIR